MPEEGLSSPLRGDSALSRFIIGGLLVFLSFLVVPAIPLLGYLTEVLGSAARDEAEPNPAGVLAGIGVVGLLASALVFCTTSCQRL